jgi:iron complex transport system substrate-binding protein
MHEWDTTAHAIWHHRRNEPDTDVLLLEWTDPPFTSGHWNPEIIERAGGYEVLARAGERSRVCTWDEIERADPDLIIVAPCGFMLPRVEREIAALQAKAEWTRLRAVRDGRVIAVDGNAYFSRPGPRLLESLAIAAAAIHPDGSPYGAPAQGEGGWRRWASEAL